MAKHLSIDFETYSEADLLNAGAHNYAMDSSTEVLCAAYVEYDDIFEVRYEDIKVWSPYIEPQYPMDLYTALMNPDTQINAFNANFERLINKHVLKLGIPITRYHDIQADLLYQGMPKQSLKDIAEYLKVQDLKMSEGKDLIKKFCLPRKPTIANPSKRIHPLSDTDAFALLIEYCRRDVWAEIQVKRAIMRKPQRPAIECTTQLIDWVVNDNGLLIDPKFAEAALFAGDRAKADAKFLGAKNYGVANVASGKQMLEAMNGRGYNINSMNAETLKSIKHELAIDEPTKHLLAIRKEATSTSLSKYKTALKVMNSDNRIRSCIMYYGANRTGRYAGKLVQVHNFPKGYEDTDKITDIRNKIKMNIPLQSDTGLVIDQIKNVMRSMIIAPPGQKLIVVDFSAIEARVLAWLAGEQWRLDIFTTHGKIYEASASSMYNIPLETIVKGHENYKYRSLGKVAELALGYGGGIPAIRSMDFGGDLEHLSDAEVDEMKNAWRSASPNVSKFWKSLNNACIDAVVHNTPQTCRHFLCYQHDGDLRIVLPSGRELVYANIQLSTGRFGNPALTYDWPHPKTRKIVRTSTYGGKLAENVTQAVARDVLSYAMLNLYSAGYKIVGHVHDEVIIESTEEHLDIVNQIMCQVPAWAQGLPLAAAGEALDFYKK